MSKDMTATAYLVLKATRRRYGRADSEMGLMPVEEVKAVTLRQARPKSLARDEIAVKVQLQIPATAFDPIAPSALVVVPSDLALRGPIEATVADANEETSL